MRGGVFGLMKRDVSHFVTKGGWEEDIVLSTPDGNIILELTGYATKHWMNFDSTGLPINSKNAHISLPEPYLVEKGYPVRNSKGEVSLKNHKVSFPDSSGVVKNYVIRENFPDETTGVIVLILADYIP